MKNEKKINDLITLLNNKQYGKIIFEIESNFDDKKINSQILLILGLAKMKLPNRKFDDVLSALQNFKEGYILDKKSKIGLWTWNRTWCRLFFKCTRRTSIVI